MFDIAFDSIAAFNQVLMFLAALFLLLIGGLIVCNYIHWRLHATRVEGTIIGVRKKGNIYRPVYRYMLPTGETHEATSDTGSSLIRGKETGSVHPLLVFPEEPWKVTPAGGFAFLFIGALILLPGFVFLYVALTAYEVTAFTVAAFLGILIYFAIHIRKYILPKAERGAKKAAWKQALREKRQTQLEASPMRPIEEFISMPEALAEKEQQAKAAKVMAPILALAAIGLIWAGVYFGNQQLALDDHGLKAEGTVVRLEESRSNNSTSYYPVVRFENNLGHSVEFKDRAGSSPPLYRSGEKVQVLYLEDNPKGSAAIDKGIFNWGIPLALLLFGTLLGIVSLGLFKNLRCNEPL